MPTISQRREYAGLPVLVDRLGLSPIIRELTGVLTGFDLHMKEQKSGVALRKILDGRFTRSPGWVDTKSHGVDWTRCHSVKSTRVCTGVVVQVSGPTDLLVMDICHLRDALTDGHIDIGVLVVPDDELGHFLTDRGPKFSDAVRHVRAARAEDFPLLVLGIHHDGPGEPLAKQFKASQKLS